MTFDADSHVEESPQTWKHLEEKFARRRPIPITLEDQSALLEQNSFWLTDGAVVPAHKRQRIVAVWHTDHVSPRFGKTFFHR
jgi:hypothetical protein